MLRTILVTGGLLAGCATTLSACGQKGNLVHPTTPAPAGRATLMQALTPSLPASAPITVPTDPDVTQPLPLPGR